MRQVQTAKAIVEVSRFMANVCLGSEIGLAAQLGLRI